MKTIIVKWFNNDDPYTMSPVVMRVIVSDHPRFKAGTRFDYGFFNIATEEGYTIISLPNKELEGNE